MPAGVRAGSQIKVDDYPSWLRGTDPIRDISCRGQAMTEQLGQRVIPTGGAGTQIPMGAMVTPIAVNPVNLVLGNNKPAVTDGNGCSKTAGSGHFGTKDIQATLDATNVPCAGDPGAV